MRRSSLTLARRVLQGVVGLVVAALACLSAVTLADAALGGGLKPDVRLIIDISGSMKQSDPKNLRAPALDLIIRLLPEGARAGVWIFGQEVELLVPHGAVDEQWRRTAQQAVANIDNSGLRTNIPAALAAATYDLQSMDPGYRTSIILLTDGKVDIAESPMANISAARAVLANLSLELGARGIPVHTIALSEEADWIFLRALAQNTHGIAEKAESAQALTAIFLQSLETVAPAARVPVVGSGFLIDPSVEEFTALIFFDQDSSPVGLVSPSGTKYTSLEPVEGVQWFSNEQFALVTVTAPEAGRWLLQARESAMTRVTVISDLEIEVDPLPHNLSTGRQAELGLRLRESGQVVSDPQVLALFDITVEVRGEGADAVSIDVSRQYPVPDNGEFRVAVPPFEQPGRYQVLVRVNARTLQRELPMIVDVTATAANPTIVTRNEAFPEDDFKTPLVGAAAALLLGAAVIAMILRRRRRRRLELWQRRSRLEEGGAAAGDLLQGLTAAADDQNPH